MKPYKLHEGGTSVLDAEGNLVASCGFLPGRELADWKHMAAEIVRACNAHDDLLAALKYIEGRLPSHDTRSIQQARIAIAKAEGTETR